MWELDHKESWELKNWCFWTVVLEKTLESPLYCKEIQPVHPKGNQPWMFIGRTEAETALLWPPDVKNWLIEKDPDAGKVWRWEKKGTTEDEMVGWHHRLDGHEFEQALGVGDRQGSLVCCSTWGHKESDTTERLNWLTVRVVYMLKDVAEFLLTPGHIISWSKKLKFLLSVWLLATHFFFLIVIDSKSNPLTPPLQGNTDT